MLSVFACVASQRLLQSAVYFQLLQVGFDLISSFNETDAHYFEPDLCVDAVTGMFFLPIHKLISEATTIAKALPQLAQAFDQIFIIYFGPSSSLPTDILRRAVDTLNESGVCELTARRNFGRCRRYDPTIFTELVLPESFDVIRFDVESMGRSAELAH